MKEEILIVDKVKEYEIEEEVLYKVVIIMYERIMKGKDVKGIERK